MIVNNNYTLSFSQKKDVFSIKDKDLNFPFSFVNGYSLDQIRSNLKISSGFYSEYLLQKHEDSILEKHEDSLIKKMLIHFSKEQSSNIIFSDSSYFEKPLKELENKICNIYNKYQTENWDGYGAEPIKYLDQSLQFAKDLFLELRILVESVDIIPENDGCLCFEWFKSNSKYASISVKGDKLIYTYKLGDDKACGERTYSGKQMIIEQIKKIA